MRYTTSNGTRNAWIRRRIETLWFQNSTLHYVCLINIVSASTIYLLKYPVVVFGSTHAHHVAAVSMASSLTACHCTSENVKPAEILRRLGIAQGINDHWQEYNSIISFVKGDIRPAQKYKLQRTAVCRKRHLKLSLGHQKCYSFVHFR